MLCCCVLLIAVSFVPVRGYDRPCGNRKRNFGNRIARFLQHSIAVSRSLLIIHWQWRLWELRAHISLLC
jgi:hypothetical protein